MDETIQKGLLRRTVRIAAAAVLLAALLPSASHQAAPAPAAKVKLATLAPRGSSFHKTLLAMGEKWRSAPGGGVALTVYPDGAMGGEADVVRKMRIGQVQAAMLTAVGLSEIDESVSAVQFMPMMFRSLQEVDYVNERMRPLLEKRIRDKGFVVLFWGDAGWIRLFSKEQALRPADVKPMKLFSWAGDNRFMDILKASGYRPVPLETADILPGFQTGLINAVFTIPYYALTTQIYASAPHMLELNWAPLLGGTVVTRKAWDGLPAETQAALRTAAAEAGAQIQAQSRREGDEAVEAMKKRGLVVHAVTPDLDAEWRAAAEAVYPQIRGKIVPADLFDEVQRLLREYRAAADAPKG
jgi:TRAP-type C4-dicarboxylate transport system substrate-binding protein